MEVGNNESLLTKIDGIIEECTGRKLNIGQRLALQGLFSETQSVERTRLVIGMPTGSGKTRLAASIVLYLGITGRLRNGDKVLIMAPRKVIIKQNKSQLEMVLKSKSVPLKFRIETAKTKSNRFHSQMWNPKTMTHNLHLLLSKSGLYIDVLLLTPQLWNLYVSTYDSENFMKIKAIILDEVHHTYWGSEVSNSIEQLLGSGDLEFALGLSATPTKEAIGSFGRLYCPLTTMQAMKEGILISGLKIYSTDTYAYLIESSLDQWKVAIYERAQKYAENIIELMKLETDASLHLHRIPKTLVVAANTTEAEELRKYLVQEVRNAGREDADDLAFMAHYKVKKHDYVIKKFKEKQEGILVTVDMAKMGFDDPNLEFLVIARPVNTPLGYVQIRGRVLRRTDEEAHEKNIKLIKSKAILIDFTNSARFENIVNKVEDGELANEYSSDQLLSDLSGKGYVPRVHAEVKIGDFRVMEIGAEEGKEKPAQTLLTAFRAPEVEHSPFLIKEPKLSVNPRVLSIKAKPGDVVQEELILSNEGGITLNKVDVSYNASEFAVKIPKPWIQCDPSVISNLSPGSKIKVALNFSIPPDADSLRYKCSLFFNYIDVKVELQVIGKTANALPLQSTKGISEADRLKVAYIPQISKWEEPVFKMPVIVRSLNGVERRCISISEVESAVKSSLEEGNKFSLTVDRYDEFANSIVIKLKKRFREVSSAESVFSGIREITFTEP